MPSSGSKTTNSLSPLTSRSCGAAAGQELLLGHDPDAVVGVALLHRRLELRQRLVLGHVGVLGLEDDPGARRAGGALDADERRRPCARRRRAGRRPRRSRRRAPPRSRRRRRTPPPRTGGPSAVERACSAATSSCFSRSAWSLTTSSLSAAICSLSAFRLPSCCSAARFMAAIVPALKSASGLCASAEENCLSRSSRIRAEDSAITSRSWCWTATEDSAPNSRSSSLARWPLSGANTSSTRLPRNSATVRALSVNAPSTSRETFSNSVRTKSALTSACSRESTRAPISIASTSTAAVSAPAASRSRTSSTATRSRTARPSATTTSPKTETRGGRRGVAASMAVGRTVRAAPDGTPLRPRPARARSTVGA